MAPVPRSRTAAASRRSTQPWGWRAASDLAAPPATRILRRRRSSGKRCPLSQPQPRRADVSYLSVRDRRRASRDGESSMKNVVRTFVLTAAAFALTLSTAAAQATVHGDLLKDWTAMKDQMAKEAAAMPEDKYGFKPTPAQRS